MGYHPGPLPSPQMQYVPIPEGDAGLFLTLHRIAQNIRGHNPLTDALALRFPSDPGMTETEAAAEMFAWAQQHIRYLEEEFPLQSDISDSIATPDAILVQIMRHGWTWGDCAHYATLLGALYVRHGWPVTLAWVKTHNPEKLNGIEDHVFVLVETDDGMFTADGIVPEPFGWEIPAEEQLGRVELPV